MSEKPGQLTDDELREWKNRVDAAPNKVPAQETQRTLRFEFTADGREYFRIWIVNVSLTVITLGIYSAWAKVRRMRYLYGHTRLDGATFDYLAEPIKILKGRLIAAGAFAVFVGVVNFYPNYLFFVLIVFMPFFPWLINRALVFKTRNTAYRNIRFNFTGTYGNAFWVFVILLALGLTGVFYPLFVHRRKRYVYNNMRYGTASFEFTGRFAELFGTYFVASITAAFALGIVGFLAPLTSVALIGDLASLLIAGIFFVAIQTAVTNYSWRNTTLGDIHLASELKFPRLFSIYASNIVLIVLTLGLYIPWAKVRLLRYRLESLSLATTGSLDDFVASQEEQMAAAGEEMGEVFDWDFGL